MSDLPKIRGAMSDCLQCLLDCHYILLLLLNVGVWVDEGEMLEMEMKKSGVLFVVIGGCSGSDLFCNLLVRVLVFFFLSLCLERYFLFQTQHKSRCMSKR